ncbi:MAG: serine/threonine-protein phosphatase [Oscillatoria sp. SIO1A7]|nr:serine/threonine-protein phosphatase [Oscillatoria sp. SIO1A7]
MKRYFAGLTDPGLVRSVNQDAYYIDEPKGRFFIVADGMGGHAGGQEASKIAIEAIRGYLVENWDSEQTSQELLEHSLYKANRDIVFEQAERPELGDMGTTVVVVIFRGDREPWVAHVGDSRLYRLRGSKLEQITEDHTWVARGLKAGHLKPEEVRIHPLRHVLSQCLGREELEEFGLQQVDVQPGDRLLLCSDGLTEELSDAAISSILKSVRSSQGAAQKLVSEAKDKGGRDNITVIPIVVDLLNNGD